MPHKLRESKLSITRDGNFRPAPSDVASASSPRLPSRDGFSLVRLSTDHISAKPASNVLSFYAALNLISRVHDRVILYHDELWL